MTFMLLPIFIVLITIYFVLDDIRNTLKKTYTMTEEAKKKIQEAGKEFCKKEPTNNNPQIVITSDEYYLGELIAYNEGGKTGYALASEEQREGWVNGVPKITEECVFVTATRHKSKVDDYWDYSVWEAKVIEGVNEKDEGAYYLALLDGDGEEWGPLDELVADKTFILPKT